MKKIIGFGVLGFICVCISFSCKESESYAKKIKRERSAINQLISDSSFVIVDEYPKSGVFKKNEFYYDENTKVYFNVVDSGNGLRAETGRIVYVRFKGATSIFQRDSVPDSNTSPSDAQQYIDFKYGYTGTYYESSLTTTWPNYVYKSPGMILPLAYVGDSAIVRLIVPFNQGSGLQRNSYEPVFIDWLQYDFRKGQGE